MFGPAPVTSATFPSSDTSNDYPSCGPGAAGTLIGALGLATAPDLTNAVLVIRGPFRVRAHDI